MLIGSLESFGIGAGGYAELGMAVPSAVDSDQGSLFLNWWVISVDVESNVSMDPEAQAIMDEIEAQDRDAITPLCWATLILIVISALSLIRGGKAGMTSIVGIEACSGFACAGNSNNVAGSYWVVTALSMITMVGSTIFFGQRSSREAGCELGLGSLRVMRDVWRLVIH